MNEPASGTTVRLIKVGRTTQVRRSGGSSVVVVPFIRLSGKWIERAGFLEGDTIAVTGGNGQISIIRQGHHGVPGWVQSELF